jgi:hypothetical protein
MRVMRGGWGAALGLAAWIGLIALACASGGGDDDDGDDTGADDDSGDDDSGDDDTAGPTPVIDTLHPYPPEVYPGNVINMNFHFTDGDANLMGGSIHIAIEGHAEEVKTIPYDPGAEGHITTYATTGVDWAPGELAISVYIVDAGGLTSNTITAEFVLNGPNTAPSISNLRFDPNPACNLEGSPFTILFDFFDPDGNLGGGSLGIYTEDDLLPQQFLIDGSFDEIAGTLPIEATLTGDAPDGATLSIGIVLVDNQQARSNRLDETITFDNDACL